MSNRDQRERQRMMAALPDAGEVAPEIFAAMATVGTPGEPMTRELAELASQVAGAEAAARWLRSGRSMEDCGMVRRFYEYVGNQIGVDVSPGGRLAGSTLPEDDGHGAPTGDASVADSRGIRNEPALDADPVTLISTAGGYIDGSWDYFQASPFSQRLDGMWVLNNYPSHGVLALQFMGRDFSGFAEVFQEDIATVQVAAKGINLAVEVADCNGERLVAVGPKRRLRNIFNQLGHRI